jgi:hypothetical protein
LFRFKDVKALTPPHSKGATTLLGRSSGTGNA